MKNKAILSVLSFLALMLSGCGSTLPMDNKQIVYATYHPTTLVQDEVVAPILSTEIERIESVLAEPPTGSVLEIEESGDGIPWLISVSKKAMPTLEIKEYEIVKDQDGNIVSKTYLEDNYQYIEGSAEVSSYGGAVAQGSYFFPKITTYGVDCKGCNGETTGVGGTSIGIKLDINQGVKQADGTFLPGVTYQGYYLVAADNNLPLGTVLEISEHTFSGAGLTPGVPFKAIVADRGGGVRGAHLDIYVGSEKASLISRIGSNQAKAEILCVGKGCY